MWRSEGIQKSGKTLVLVGISFAFGFGCGYNVFTNMTSLKYRGHRWATTITIDDLFRDMAEPDKRKWKIRDGFLVIDEAPTWFLKGAQGGSNVGQLLARCSVQLLKHNVKMLYSAHLGDMMPSFVDNLTEVVFECKTDDGGEHIAFRTYDNQHRIEAWRNKWAWGERDKAHWWVPGGPFYDIYDYEEGMPIFATDFSAFAGASGRRRAKALSGTGIPADPYPTNPRDIAALVSKVDVLQSLLAQQAAQGGFPLRPTKAEQLRERVGAL